LEDDEVRGNAAVDARCWGSIGVVGAVDCGVLAVVKLRPNGIHDRNWLTMDVGDVDSLFAIKFQFSRILLLTFAIKI
jgi:hypothetical protein